LLRNIQKPRSNATAPHQARARLCYSTNGSTFRHGNRIEGSECINSPLPDNKTAFTLTFQVDIFVLSSQHNFFRERKEENKKKAL
jgi:hypothetical protein